MGKSVHIVDGSTHSAPDTPENQAEYPQSRSQATGVGFPLLRTLAVVSLAAGMIKAFAIGADDLADLYRKRWRVELHLRDIKSTMELDVLRGQTPARLRQELWTGLLAYNLVRQSMLQAALKAEEPPHHLSFAAGLQSLETTWLIAALPENTPLTRESLVTLKLLCCASRRVGNRPDRVEPRAIKRRTSSHKLLRETRAAALAKLQGRAA